MIAICFVASLAFLFALWLFWVANSDSQTKKPNGEWS